MKICLLTLAITIVTNAQNLYRLGDGVQHDQVIEHDFVEVDPIVFSGYNTGLSVYFGTVNYIWDSTEVSMVSKLEIFSVILGDLENNNYYQTYF